MLTRLDIAIQLLQSNQNRHGCIGEWVIFFRKIRFIAASRPELYTHSVTKMLDAFEQEDYVKLVAAYTDLEMFVRLAEPY
jgi:hypothetical protein